MLSMFSWSEYAIFNDNLVEISNNCTSKILKLSNNLSNNIKNSNSKTNSSNIKLYQKSLKLLELKGYFPSYTRQKLFSDTVNWDSVPDTIHPDHEISQLPNHRKQKKRNQVENMLQPCIEILNQLQIHTNRRLRIVEFCSGSGSVGIPLAYLYPQHEIVLIDAKETSLDIARDKISTNNLSNVLLLCQDIDDYQDSFDLGISLHACGGSTDITLEK